MKKAIAWHVGADGRPVRLEPGTIDLERNLEDWVEADIGIVTDDVLVIGRQVYTGTGFIDLLGIDANANLVIIELKRGQTLRETVAQGIEYAAWAARQGAQSILEIGSARFGSRTAFEEAFDRTFGATIPEGMNAGQRILVVAPAIDDGTAGVIEYLRSAYGMPINAVSFDVFGPPGDQTLVRHFVAESQADIAPRADSKKQPARTEVDTLALAKERAVEHLIQPLLELRDLFAWDLFHNKNGWTCFLPTPEYPQGASALRAVLREQSVGVQLRADNIAGAFGIPLDDCRRFIDDWGARHHGEPFGKGFTLIHFRDLDSITAFADAFRALVASGSGTPDELVGGTTAPPPSDAREADE